MQPLNNLDVVILIITAVSALIALFRGLVKEVLSIVGWTLAAVVVFYMLPILTPIAKNYIASSMMASIVTALAVLIVFYVVWLLTTDKLIGKIRSSKLSALDRVLGLLFGVVRACLIVILFNILLSWVLPEESKEGMFKESRYFQLAGEFAKPIEGLIPEETKNLIKIKKDETEQKAEEIKKDAEQKAIDELFEKLAQPQIEKVVTKSEEETENFEGYKENQTDNLDRLIEATVE
ncbi:MAG: CvpA family protein [Alphaproteobacteria bacterium]|nr:CvpA family protein [Alphaproteobacteria bacterium]